MDMGIHVYRFVQDIFYCIFVLIPMFSVPLGTVKCVPFYSS